MKVRSIAGAIALCAFAQTTALALAAEDFAAGSAGLANNEAIEVKPQLIPLQGAARSYDYNEGVFGFIQENSRGFLLSAEGFHDLETGEFISIAHLLQQAGHVQADKFVAITNKRALSADRDKLAILVEVSDHPRGDVTCAASCKEGLILSTVILDAQSLEVLDYIQLDSSYASEIGRVIGENGVQVISSGTVLSEDADSLFFAVEGAQSKSAYIVRYEISTRSWYRHIKLGSMGFQTMFDIGGKVVVVPGDGQKEFLVFDKLDSEETFLIPTKPLPKYWSLANDWSGHTRAHDYLLGFSVGAKEVRAYALDSERFMIERRDGRFDRTLILANHFGRARKVSTPLPSENGALLTVSGIQGERLLLTQIGRQVPSLCLMGGARDDLAGYSIKLSDLSAKPIRCRGFADLEGSFVGYTPSSGYAFSSKGLNSSLKFQKVGSPDVYVSSEAGMGLVLENSRSIFVVSGSPVEGKGKILVFDKADLK